ncbi:MAG: ribosome maturation factor RimM [Gammaproteobacteria bacterium]|nr:ribosome maturation factor RimM [Gammaproteobacteria bacterium]NNE05942.1 ribosome maturation factor RimM [Xanthomonadales bacterium]
MGSHSGQEQELVLLGHVSGVFGIKGWVKIHSWTNPREAIIDYQPWLLGEKMAPVRVLDGRLQGKTVVAALEGVCDPEQAAGLRGQEIKVQRKQLPDPRPGSWYWADLVGLDVVTAGGERLGEVKEMMETGAHDVMVVKGERQRLIPFVPERFVLKVDIEQGQVVVDWQADYLD